MSIYSDGLVLLDKPPGLTSSRAIDTVRRALKPRKVGHTGTLDRFAEGLLAVLAGRFTRLTPIFMELEKEYVACLRFGEETDTLDPEGSVVAEADVPTLCTIEAALLDFDGELEQVPPLFSALHYKGERAHVLARSGRKVELAARRVTIFAIEVLDFRAPFLTMRVVCSKGTYIRALARDLGLRCGSRARLESLTRTRIGSFQLESAVRPEDFDPSRDLQPPSAFAAGIAGLVASEIKPERVRGVVNGLPLDDGVFVSPPTADGTYALFGESRELLAVAVKTGSRYKYMAVFGGPQPEGKSPAGCRPRAQPARSPAQ